MRAGLLLCLWLTAAADTAADTPAPTATQVNDEAAAEQLLGSHPLSLQWIGWDKPGACDVTRDGELLTLTGSQKNKAGDFLEVRGVVERVDARSFVLVGTIRTHVSYIAQGRTCERTGRHTFRMTGKRRYWRLAQMQNPCDGVVDYVDIYLR
jgi:hypothetical protein